VKGPGGRGNVADFAGMFTALLEAAQLTADKLLRELENKGQPAVVSRATVYDWAKGQHLPADEAAFRAVVRVCLRRAQQRGVLPPVTDEAGWMSLLHNARRSTGSSAERKPEGGRGRSHGGAGRAASEWDPVALGVHRAVGGDPLPTFVRRPHDELLDTVMDPDAAGSRLVVLRGGPSTGKSRSAYNAMCAGRLASWRLEYPPIPAELTRLLEEGIRPRTLIWLRELRDYADADGGQEALARLARVLADTGRIIAIATTWEPFWSAYTRDHRGDAGSRNPYLGARALLAGLPKLSSVTGVSPGRGGVIDVPDEFSEGELAHARELPDLALAEAIEAAARDGKPRRVIQYLAAVPDLLDYYEGAGSDPYARAVITVAMDVARMTGLQRCTPGFLQRAVGGYLPGEHRADPPDDWCDTAIKAATAELRGAVRALTPEPRRQGTGVATYRLADYLDQHGRKILADQIPPLSLWKAATQSDPSVQMQFGKAAVDRGLLKMGAQLLKNATVADAEAGTQLVQMMHSLHPEDVRPACWVAEHASLVGPRKVSLLLSALRKAGAGTGLATLIQRDPAAHADVRDLASASFLIGSLHEAGADDQVAALLASDPVLSADTADSGIYFLLATLREIGATEQLRTLAERATASDDMAYPEYTAALLDALRDIEAEDQVKALIARRPAVHVDMEEPLYEVVNLITALDRVGADEQVAVLAKRAVAAADPDDLMSTSELLTTLHDVGCAQMIPSRLVNGLTARADITNAGEVAMLLETFAAIGADAEVSAILARDPAASVDLASATGVAFLLRMLKETGADEQVAALLARDPLAHVGRGEAAAALLEFRPTLGIATDATIMALIERLPAEGSFTSFLHYTKRAEDYRFGRRHDGRAAVPWGWDDLE
jgi:hypothetical protein